ncbi:MAG: hypothetical protein Q4D26_11710 [Clostridia bacterium]|nr:hypothetical protein [Clostridia bacterium]
MEIINAVIENTNSPEIQAILAKLNPEEDILFTNESEDGSSIEVEYIEPINNIRVIGSIPEDIIAAIKEKYGDDASIDIYDYIVTYDRGMYGLAVDIEADKVEEEKPVKERKLPLPLLIVIGMATALLTLVLIVIKLIFSSKKNK